MQLPSSALTRLIVGEAELFDLPVELPLLLSKPLVPEAGELVSCELAATVAEIEPPSSPAPSNLHAADLSDR
jgi:hypothetical protein